MNAIDKIVKQIEKRVANHRKGYRSSTSERGKDFEIGAINGLLMLRDWIRRNRKKLEGK